jgi:hypothetical protein
MAFPEGVIHCCEVISSSYHLDDGPSVRASIGATYAGKELPTILVNLGANVLTCPNTGKLTSQKDNDKVFLVSEMKQSGEVDE